MSNLGRELGNGFDDPITFGNGGNDLLDDAVELGEKGVDAAARFAGSKTGQKIGSFVRGRSGLVDDAAKFAKGGGSKLLGRLPLTTGVGSRLGAAKGLSKSAGSALVYGGEMLATEWKRHNGKISGKKALRNHLESAGGFLGSVGGASIGASTGASVGAAVGTMVAPGIGTAIGAGLGYVGGGLIGGFAGAKLGEATGDLAGDLFVGSSKKSPGAPPGYTPPSHAIKNTSMPNGGLGRANRPPNAALAPPPSSRGGESLDITEIARNGSTPAPGPQNTSNRAKANKQNRQSNPVIEQHVEMRPQSTQDVDRKIEEAKREAVEEMKRQLGPRPTQF